MADKELVCDVGVEGAGASVFRTPLGPGKWQFHAEGTSMGMDENDDEEWRSWQSEQFQTLEEADCSVSANGGWLLFYPISIHPDHRAAVWKLVQEAVQKLPEGRRTKWENRMQDRFRKEPLRFP